MPGRLLGQCETQRLFCCFCFACRTPWLLDFKAVIVATAVLIYLWFPPTGHFSPYSHCQLQTRKTHCPSCVGIPATHYRNGKKKTFQRVHLSATSKTGKLCLPWPQSQTNGESICSPCFQAIKAQPLRGAALLDKACPESLSPGES